MFQVCLATAPNPPKGTLRIRVEGLQSPNEFLTMPVSGEVKVHELPMPKGANPKLKIHFFFNDHRVAIELGKARPGDSLSLVVLRGSLPVVSPAGALYVGNLMHGDGRDEPCDLKCESGVREEDECCVNCREGGEIVARVCC